jgi:hypothetical protein
MAIANDMSADANQHLRVCRIALASTCADAASTNSSVESEILKGLKEMVAIAHCNTHCISVPWKAAHAVHKFAVVLQDDLDRCKMIEFLEEVNAMDMPTVTSVEYLREQWGWHWGHNLNQLL